MVSDTEVAKTSAENQRPNPEKLKLYIDIVYKQSTHLLAKYLPEALPEEPTEIVSGEMISNYLGKFQGRHWIALAEDQELHPITQALRRGLLDLEWAAEQNRLLQELYFMERVKMMKEKAEKGDFSDIEEKDYDERIRTEEEKILQRPKPPFKSVIDSKDYQNPEKLLQGPDQYSSDSWRDVYSLVHELIHQKQAELYPSAFAPLTSPVLDGIDPDTTDRGRLYSLLLEVHKARNRVEKNDSLFDPVIEGMASVGSFFVMGALAEDLAKAGEKDAASKVRQVRMAQIYHEFGILEKRGKTLKGDEYDTNYAKGINMMRKLYKHFGLETPQVLMRVDLVACRQIPKTSDRYQQIMQNPLLLPGLPQAA